QHALGRAFQRVQRLADGAGGGHAQRPELLLVQCTLPARAPASPVPATRKREAGLAGTSVAIGFFEDSAPERQAREPLRDALAGVPVAPGIVTWPCTVLPLRTQRLRDVASIRAHVQHVGS